MSGAPTVCRFEPRTRNWRGRDTSWWHAARRASLNRMAAAATTHCLTGCAIGEVLGLAIATQLGWGNEASIVLAIILAYVFGYALTLRPLLRSGLTVSAALGVAFAADTLSITVMEVVDNAVVLVVPGAMDAGLTDPLFWGALLLGARDRVGGRVPGQPLAPGSRHGTRQVDGASRPLILARFHLDSRNAGTAPFADIPSAHEPTAAGRTA